GLSGCVGLWLLVHFCMCTHGKQYAFFRSVRQVRSAVALSREASGSLCGEAVLGEEAAALGEADSGVFSLGNAELFPDRSVVLWLGVQSLVFTLVCRPHENLLLAEGTLRNIARHCLEELRLLGPGAEVRFFRV
uniref:Adaptor related protein complex 5 subunit sigma 1 n=1 Tax=Sinocyclocheilus grahami TaxID=75366 RepID=A0A672KC62_SINGR